MLPVPWKLRTRAYDVLMTHSLDAMDGVRRKGNICELGELAKSGFIEYTSTQGKSNIKGEEKKKGKRKEGKERVNRIHVFVYPSAVRPSTHETRRIDYTPHL